MTTVLLAGRDRDALSARAFTLREAGLKIEELSADANADAISAATAQGDTALVLDASLPSRLVLQVARALRGTAATSGIPILLIASSCTPPDELAAALEYVDALLTEPVPDCVLAAQVRALLRNSGQRRRRLQSESRYRSLFENMTEQVHDWEIIRDEQGALLNLKLSDANTAALESWAKALNDVRGKTPDEIFGPGTTAQYLPIVEKILSGAVPYTFENYLPQSDQHFRLTALPMGDHLIIAGAEITQLRQAERELRRAHQQLEAIMKAVPVGLSYSDDPSCEHITGNPAVQAQFEASFADNLSASSPNPADAGRRVQFYQQGRLITDAELPLQRAVAERREIAPIELEVCLPSGRRWFAETSGAPILDSQGNVLGGVAVCVDVTERKRREDELREVVQRLSYHVDHSPLAVIEWGSDMRLVRWAGAAERVFGWRADEVVGKRMEDFRWIHEQDAGRVMEVENDLTSGRNPLRFSANRNYRKDGSIACCEWYNSALVDSAGDLRSILSLVLDVTNRTQALEALRESRDMLALAQHIGEAGSFEFDVRTKRAIFSEEMQKLYGIGPGQPHVGLEEWMGWVLAEDREHLTMQHTAGNGTHHEMSQFRICRQDTGEIRWIEGRWRTIRDESGEAVRTIGFNIDISRQKRIEDELQRTAERYRQSNEQLQQFTYVVSHDLQEPLRNISNFSELLERRLKGTLDSETLGFLNVVREGSLRMGLLIDDLLAYSRVEAGQHEITGVEMGAVVESALDNLSHAIHAAEAQVTFDPLPPVAGNHGSLVQLLQNLVGNAIKYRSKEKPRIHISVRPGPDFCTFQVRDNGIGIEPEYHERIFGIFKRLHGIHEYPGTGIGLAICRKIVERHGGRIWVESQIGQGSTFLFTLPAASGQPASSVATG